MQIKWTRRALADLDNAFEYIFQDDPNAALSVVDRIEDSIANLSRHPEIGRKGRVTSTRELVIPQTPYLVSYRVKAEQVEILAILHGKRKWPDRF